MQRVSTSQINNRKGNIVATCALLMPFLIGLAAFAIDVGYISYSRSRLQIAAEAAALAALDELPDSEGALVRSKLVAKHNFGNDYGEVVDDADIEFGTWNGSFVKVADPSQATAVRATARLAQRNSNSLALFFGALLGKATVDVEASAIAAASEVPNVLNARFLIDEDMFDKDMPGINSEAMVTARGFNQGKLYGSSSWTWEDNFLDIPAGTVLTLPTGQATSYDNNDAGLFDITTHSSFEFKEPDDLRKFIMYSESGGDNSKWGTDNSSVLNRLDPTRGVSPVFDDSTYATFVDPNVVHISPVFESDISTLNKQGGEPRVNAKGQRRGLIAYKIIAVGKNPGGSYLPHLDIEIVNLSDYSVDDITFNGNSGGSGGSAGRSAQIVGY